MRMTRARKKAADHALKVGFDIVRRTLQNPDAYPDFMVILPFDPELLSRVFTPERLRLWAELHRSRPRSLTELASRLDRNISRVRQDVLILEGVHLAKTHKKGNQVQVVAEAPYILVASPA